MRGRYCCRGEANQILDCRYYAYKLYHIRLDISLMQLKFGGAPAIKTLNTVYARVFRAYWVSAHANDD